MSTALASPRVTLRPAGPADLSAIEGWWPEAAAIVRGIREPVTVDELHRMIDEAGSEALVITRADEPTPLGLLILCPRVDEWLEFRFIALADGRRGWGYGAEAVSLVEESGRAFRFVAEVYAGNGLGLYFWLRMGHRPAEQGELPWLKREPEDKIAMIRGWKE